VRSIENLVLTLARKAEIDRIAVTPHTLRHTFAISYLKSHPGKLVDLAALLGHESLDTTAIYTRPSKEDLSDDLEETDLNLL
jgi:integrase/recombinase XerC